MPECLWKFRVKDFGPLTVGIDAHGNSLFHDVQERRAGQAQGAMPALHRLLDLGLPRSRSAGLTHVMDKGLARADRRTSSRSPGD